MLLRYFRGNFRRITQVPSIEVKHTVVELRTKLGHPDRHQVVNIAAADSVEREAEMLESDRRRPKVARHFHNR
jgi:hypothetical protein